MSMPVIRAATVSDVNALTRVHVEGGLNRDVTAAWRETHSAHLRDLLRREDPSLLAFVADAPDGPGVVSAAVGFLQHTLARPDNLAGLTAHLSSVATLARYRHYGYATAVTTAFMHEAAARGCSTVTLTATAEGMSLYRRLGFAPQPRARTRTLRTLTAPTGRRTRQPEPYRPQK